MANTVGSIEISMLANLASMVSDMGKASQESAKHAREVQRQWQDSLNSIEETFRGLAEAFGVGLSIAGLVEVAKQSLDTAEKVQNMSKSFGFSTQAIQTMGYAAALVGGNLDGATAAMARLERSAEQAAAGNVQAAAAFKAIGIDATQVAQLLKNPDELLQTVAQHMAAFGDGAGKTAAAMQIFGRGAAEIIPLLDELGSNYDELRKRAEGLGIVLSSQDQAGLVAAKEGFNDLKEAAVGLGNQFTIAMLPAINGIIEGLDSLAESGAIRSFFKDLGTDVGQFVVVAGQVAPVIAGWLTASESATGGIKSDFVSMVQSIKDWTVELANRFANNWEIMKAAWALFVAYLQNEFHLGIAQIENDLAGLAEFAGKVLAGMGNPAAMDSFNALAVGLRQAASGYKEVTADLTPYSNAIAANNEALAASLSENQKWADGTRLTAQSLTIMTTGLDQFKDSLVKGDIAGNLKKLAEAEQNVRDTAKEMIAAGADEAKVNADATQAIKTLTGVVREADSAQVQYDANAKAHANTVKALAKDYEEVAKFLDQLSGKIGGPYEKAMAEYAGALDKARAMAVKFAADGMKAVEVQKFLADATVLATQHLQEQTDAGTVIQRVLDDINKKYEEEARVIGLTGQAREIEAEYTRLQAMMDKELLSVMGPLTEEQQRQVDSLHNLAAAHVMERDAAKKAEEVEKQWQGIAVSGFDSVGKSIADFATGGIKTWKDFGKSLLGDAKQFIAAIIQEFLKLTVFNGIINRLFNLSGTAGELPTMAGGGGGFGSLISLVTGNGGSGGGSSISAGSIFSPDTWISAGKNVYNGFTSMFGGGGAPASAGQLGDFTGPGTQYLNYGGEYNITGDAAAGVDQSFNAAADFGGGAGGPGFWGSGMGSYGGVMGIAGGVLAGYNEFNAAGGGVGGVLGGAAYGIGTAAVSGAVGTAMAGGLSAGLAAIPVVGWIALAAMVINMVSGGKLFGTAWSTKTAGVDLNIGPDGGTAHTWEYQQKQGMFFSGMQKRTKDVASSPEAIKAAQDFFDSIKKVMTDSATALKIDVPPIIEASLDTINEYDKKGHVKSTKYIVEAFGQQWTEATAELAAKRIQADAILDVISHTTVGADAIAIAGQFQASADTLLDAAGTMLQATADIQSGKGLLGLNATLGDTMSEVVKLQAGGESLVQTYGRLQQEVQTMHQTFDLMGIDLGIVGKDFVELTDDMVKSAGSLQNLQTLWDDYFKNYYTGQEQQAANLKHLAQTANDDLIGIGMSASTTMAQFRSAFEAEQAKDAAAVAAGTMTAQEAADDLVKWLQAGEALAQFTAAVVQVGQAASQAVQQSTQAFQQLVQNTQSIAAQLFGTGADQIQAKIDQLMKFGNDTGMYDFRQITALKKQLADQQEAQRAASQLQLATGLIGDFGAIGAQTGETMQQIAEQFHVPLDKLESIFHTDQAGLEKQYEQAVAAAQASITTALNTTFTNELLADILAQQQGLAMPFSQADLNAAMNMQTASAAAPGNKPGAGGFGLPGAHTASIVSIAPAQATRASDIFITPTGASTTTSTAGGTTAGENALLDAVDRNTAETRALGQHINNLHGVMERNGFGAGTMGWQEGGNGLRRMALAR